MNFHKETIIIYSSVPRLFRTTYIGYLYEISQVFPVILLSEKLDSETEEALKDHVLFPNLKKIIHINQYTEKKRNLWKTSLYFSKLAKKIISDYKPDVVITDSCINPFEMYLLRYGKQSGAITVSFQAGFQIFLQKEEEERQYLQWRDGVNNLKYNSSHNKIKLIFAKFVNHLKDLYKYWVIPMFLGIYPYFQKSILKYGIYSYVRDFDYTVFFSEKECQLEKKLGRQSDKIMIYPHPLQTKARIIFEKIYHLLPLTSLTSRKFNSITIMINVNTYGHRRKDLSLIHEKDYLESRLLVINSILKILPNWILYIKPHPEVESVYVNSLREMFNLNTNIFVVSPSEPADKFIEKSDIIIGFPPPSTTLYTTTIQCPQKIILYIDFHHELLGESFSSYPAITYIDTPKKFTDIINDIKNNKFNRHRSNIKIYKKTASDILSKIIDIRKTKNN